MQPLNCTILICVSEMAPLLRLCRCLRSRCTGYRPILDAFKVFAKADPQAYTEESIAACKDASCEATLPRLGEGSGSSDDEPSSSNGHAQADGEQMVNGHVIAGAKKTPGKVREDGARNDAPSKAEVVGSASSRMALPHLATCLLPLAAVAIKQHPLLASAIQLYSLKGCGI